MAWDEDYEDGYLLDEEDEASLMEADRKRDFFSGGFRDEPDNEFYEEEKEEADSDIFPDSFEEWKLLEEYEGWEDDQDAFDHDLPEFEE